MFRFLLTLFRRRRPAPVVINHYHVRRTYLQELRDLKHVELARELGRPLRGDRLNG